MTCATDTTQATLREWFAEACENGEADPRLFQRGEPRYPWAAPLDVRVGDEVLVAQARNLSNQGIGFLIRFPLADQTQVWIRRAYEEAWIPALIEHCTKTVDKFRVGAVFMPGENQAGQ